jgi:predicted TPR repeat methyltransferase
VSADTLIYFGVLDQFLETACHALKSRGRLIFTVEELIGAEPGELYRLNPNGRYSQSRGYVRQALEHCGLRVKTVDDVILRKGHREEAVQGLVVTAIRE